MKSLVIVMAGSGESRDVTIQPGTTSRDVLNQLNLNGYVLKKDKDGLALGATENIYPLVNDGEKLWANSDTIVGRVQRFSSHAPSHSQFIGESRD